MYSWMRTRLLIRVQYSTARALPLLMYCRVSALFHNSLGLAVQTIISTGSPWCQTWTCMIRRTRRPLPRALSPQRPTARSPASNRRRDANSRASSQPLCSALCTQRASIRTQRCNSSGMRAARFSTLWTVSCYRNICIGNSTRTILCTSANFFSILSYTLLLKNTVVLHINYCTTISVVFL